jgi:methionine-rich copper-binding protein CopC
VLPQVAELVDPDLPAAHIPGNQTAARSDYCSVSCGTGRTLFHKTSTTAPSSWPDHVTPKGPMMARTVGRVAGTLLATVTTLMLATALPALAHNEFKSSNPKDGATLDTAPTAVELTFSEDLIDGQTTVTLAGPDGADTSAGTAQLSGAKVSVPLKPTKAGTYTVTWKVVADDGDVTDGTFKFTLSAAAIPTPSSSSATPTPSSTTQTPTSSAAPAPAAGNTSSGIPWWPFLVGALVLLAVVVVVVLRRRRAG